MMSIAQSSTGLAPAATAFMTLLPEPLANRVETVSGSVLPRWLSDVIAHDQDGYAIVAGNGQPMAILYSSSAPVAVATLNAIPDDDPAGALRVLGVNAAAELVVVTYRFSPSIARAATGLFWPPVRVLALADPATQIPAILGGLRSSEFTGALQLRTDDAHWSVLLFHDGHFVSAFDDGDRSLRNSLGDALLLCHGQHSTLSVCPARTADGLDDVLLATSVQRVNRQQDEAVFEIETSLITLLSELEHRLTSATSKPEQMAVLAAEALAETYQRVVEIAVDHLEEHVQTPSNHPLLFPHWNTTANALDVSQLLSSLRIATIPEAWPIAVDALACEITREFEPLLAMLAVTDESSAQSLREALTEVLHEARAVIWRWRGVHPN